MSTFTVLSRADLSDELDPGACRRGGRGGGAELGLGITLGLDFGEEDGEEDEGGMTCRGGGGRGPAVASRPAW